MLTMRMFTLGSTAIFWTTKLHNIILLLSYEAKYLVVTKTTIEIMWLQSFFLELDQNHEGSVFNCERKNAIDLVKNPVYYMYFSEAQKTKIYIQMEFWCLRRF